MRCSLHASIRATLAQDKDSSSATADDSVAVAAAVSFSMAACGAAASAELARLDCTRCCTVRRRRMSGVEIGVAMETTRNASTSHDGEKEEKAEGKEAHPDDDRGAGDEKSDEKLSTAARSVREQTAAAAVGGATGPSLAQLAGADEAEAAAEAADADSDSDGSEGSEAADVDVDADAAEILGVGEGGRP